MARWSDDAIQVVLDQLESLKSEKKVEELEKQASAHLAQLPLQRIGVSQSKFEETRCFVAALSAYRAFAKLHLGDNEAAIADANRAVSCAPEEQSFSALLAHILYCNMKIAECMELCDSILKNTADMDPTCAARVAQLKKRCEVDKRFDSRTKDVYLLEEESYSSTDGFDDTWCGPRRILCSACGKDVALDNSAGAAQSNDVSSPTLSDQSAASVAEMAKVCATVVENCLAASRSLLSGSAAGRIETVFPIVYAVLRRALHYKLISWQSFANAVSLQLVCACGDLRVYQRVASHLFSEAHRQQLFGSQQLASKVISHVSATSLRALGRSGSVSPEQRAAGVYIAAETFLFSFHFRQALSQVESTAESVRRNVVSAAQAVDADDTLPLALAVSLFPISAALFYLCAGETVQSFYVKQQRTHARVADESDPVSDVTTRFALPCEPASSIDRFAMVVSPLVASYSAKRSIDDAKSFFSELLTQFAPTEVHGALRTAITRRIKLW